MGDLEDLKSSTSHVFNSLEFVTPGATISVVNHLGTFGDVICLIYAVLARTKIGTAWPGSRPARGCVFSLPARSGSLAGPAEGRRQASHLALSVGEANS